MATLDDIAEMSRNAFDWLGSASLGWAVILALPLITLVLTRALGQYARVGGEDAMFLISLVGGLFGFVAQYFGSQQISKAEKPIAGESVLVPSLLGVGIGVAVMFTLLPPSPFAASVSDVVGTFVGSA